MVLFLVMSLFAENKELRQRAEAIWRKAEETSNLQPAKASPYEARATFTFQTVKAGALQGTYTREFADADDWMEEMKLGDYSKVSIHKGEHLYKQENADFTPLVVRYLTTAIAPLKFPTESKELVRKIRPATVNGVEATCIDSEINYGADTHKRITCVSETDGTLLSNSELSHTAFYGGYTPFQGKTLPTHLEISVRGEKVLVANIMYREQPSLKADSIQVPGGLQPERQCRKQVPPKLTSQTEPASPAGTDLKDLNKTVLLSVLIGVDGRVSKSLVMQSGGPGFDKNAEESVRQWRFKPSLCDGVPTETNIDVEINFRGYR